MLCLIYFATKLGYTIVKTNTLTEQTFRWDNNKTKKSKNDPPPTHNPSSHLRGGFPSIFSEAAFEPKDHI